MSARNRGRHGIVGPMAQDFHAAFGLGSSERRIDLVDANGVMVAAIQALHRRLTALERQNTAPRARLRTTVR